MRASGSDPLTISAHPYDGTDLVMTVRTPDGQWLCSDDAYGADPVLRVDSPADGVYAIWVGTYSEDAPESGASVSVQR